MFLKKLLTTSLYLFIFIYIVSSIIMYQPHFLDTSIYVQSGYRFLDPNQLFGIDYLETKFVGVFWLFSIFIKLFAHNQPFFYVEYIIHFLAVSISLFFIYKICKKLDLERPLRLLITFLFTVCTFYISNSNDQTITNTLLIFAIYLFIKNKDLDGQNWFAVGFLVSLASFIKVPVIINASVFPLFYFLKTYQKEDSFFVNIRLQLKQNLSKYLLLTFGTLLPWIIYFTYNILFSSLTPFFNYVLFIHKYMSLRGSDTTPFFVKLNLIPLHILFVLSCFVLYKKNKSLGLFTIIFFVINYLFAYLLISARKQYFIQVALIYPFPIGFAVFYIFSTLRKGKARLSVFYKLILLLFITVLIWQSGILYFKNLHRHYQFYTLLKNVEKEIPSPYQSRLQNLNILALTRSADIGLNLHKLINKLFYLNQIKKLIKNSPKVFLLNTSVMELNYLLIFNHSYKGYFEKFSKSANSSSLKFNHPYLDYNNRQGFPDIIIWNKKKNTPLPLFPFFAVLQNSNYHQMYKKSFKIIRLPYNNATVPLVIWTKKQSSTLVY